MPLKTVCSPRKVTVVENSLPCRTMPERPRISRTADQIPAQQKHFRQPNAEGDSDNPSHQIYHGIPTIIIQLRSNAPECRAKMSELLQVYSKRMRAPINVLPRWDIIAVSFRARKRNVAVTVYLWKRKPQRFFVLRTKPPMSHRVSITLYF